PAIRVTTEDRRRVCTDADEDGVPQRHLARVARDQHEPDRADAPDASGGQRLELPVRKQERHRGTEEQQQRDAELLGAGVEQRHLGAVRGVQQRAAERAASCPSGRRYPASGFLLCTRAHTRSTSRVPNSPYGLISSTRSSTTWGLMMLALPPSHSGNV